jgi:hypothetical protein
MRHSPNPWPIGLRELSSTEERYRASAGNYCFNRLAAEVGQREVIRQAVRYEPRGIGQIRQS